MEILILIPFAILLLSAFRRKASASASLKPFEFSGTAPEDDRTEFLASSSLFAGNNAIVLLLLLATIPGLLFFALNYFSRGTDSYFEHVRTLDKVVGGVINFLLLIVAISLRNARLKFLLIILVLLQIGIYIFYNFYQN